MNNKIQTVSDIGEFALIDRIQKILPSVKNERVLVAIGDDTAVIRISDERALLVTCDIQVEDQHFRLNNMTHYQLGRRAIAVNLSDIAAMGGKPTFALVSLGLPRLFPLPDFENLFKGMRDQLAEFSAIIIGGNLSKTESKLIIDITMMGEVTSGQYLTRGGARTGDRIFVTGTVGASGAGFHVLTKFGNEYPPEFRYLVEKHLQPIPRVEIGEELARAGFATAMIDLSDGIASDLYHICKMSDVGGEIYQEKLPLPENINKVASLTRKAVLHFALHSGEDYELLFTAKPNIPDSLIHSIAKKTGVPITEIGKIQSKSSGYVSVDNQGRRIPIQPKGWDHFDQNNENI